MSKKKQPARKPVAAQIGVVSDNGRIPLIEGSLHANPDGGTVFVGFPVGKPLKPMSIPFADWEPADWVKPAHRPKNPIEDSFTDYLRGVIAIERHSPAAPAKRAIEGSVNNIGMSAQVFRNKKKDIKPYLRPGRSLLVGKTDDGKFFAAVLLGKQTEQFRSDAFVMIEGDKEATYAAGLSFPGAKLINLI